MSSYDWKSNTVTFATGTDSPTQSFTTGASYTIDLDVTENLTNADFEGRTVTDTITLVVKNAPTAALRYNTDGSATYTAPPAGHIIIDKGAYVYFSGSTS